MHNIVFFIVVVKFIGALLPTGIGGDITAIDGRNNGIGTQQLFKSVIHVIMISHTIIAAKERYIEMAPTSGTEIFQDSFASILPIHIHTDSLLNQ